MTWTAPAVDRVEPGIADERASLEAWLDYHRLTLQHKIAGLTAEQLAQRSVEPSNLSLLGLVRHMADVERAWFRTRFAGEELGYIYCDEQTNPDGDFDDIDPATAEADVAIFVHEVELARAAAAGRPLEQRFRTRRGEELDLRWIYLHMIEEYARHNGHADLLRERIDGVIGD